MSTALQPRRRADASPSTTTRGSGRSSTSSWSSCFVLLGGWILVSNTMANLARLGVASGFGFLERPSGFDIGQTLIDYSAASTFGRAFLVGFLNTILVAVVGIILATIIGFTMGIARLSHNWLVSTLATVYVEIVRNIPLLLQLLLVYARDHPLAAAAARERHLAQRRAAEHRRPVPAQAGAAGRVRHLRDRRRSWRWSRSRSCCAGRRASASGPASRSTRCATSWACSR